MSEVGNYETTEVYKIFIGYLRAVDGFLEFNEAIFQYRNKIALTFKSNA